MSVTDASESRRRRRACVQVVLLAGLTRVAYLAFAGPTFAGPYWALSDGLLHEHALAIGGQLTTDYEPVYPLFLALCRLITFDHVLIVELLQVAVASCGAIAMYRIVLALTDSAGVAKLAAVLYAVDPLLVRESVLLSESALATTLLMTFAAAFVTARTPRGAATAGVWLGIAVLTRTTTLPLVLLAPAILVVNGRRHLAWRLAASAIVLIVMLPIRNHAVNGSTWPTRSGINLFIGNSPYSAALIPASDLDLLQPYAYALIRQTTSVSPDTPEYDRIANDLLAERALAFMRQSPFATLRSKLRNVLYFVGPLVVPYRTSTAQTRVVIEPDGRMRVENERARPLVDVVGYAVWQTLAILLFCIGCFVRKRAFRRDSILWAVAATFVAVHALYFPATRYRAPMEFVTLMYSALGLWSIADAALPFARSAEKRLTVEAAALLLLVRVGLWTLPFATLQRLLNRVAPAATGPTEDPQSVGRVVSAVARRLPFMTCLVEALAAQAMLRRRGRDSTVRFGVRSGEIGGRAIDAHAWLVCDDLVVVGEIDEMRDYATLEGAKRQ